MNTLGLTLLATVVVVMCASCGDNDKSSDSQQYEAVIHSPAFRSITDSINKMPDDPRPLLIRALRLSQQNLHKFATADYKKAYELTGDEGVALEYASNLLLAGEVKEALALLEEASERFGGNTEFNRRLAEIYVQNGADEKALEELNKIIAKDDSNFEAWYEKGVLLLRTKDTAASIEALEHSFSLLPINLSGMALANIYVAQKNPRALEICNTLLSNDTANVQTEPVYMKGVYYTEVKEYGNAIKQFDECIRRDWKMTDAYIEKGIIFYEQKKYDEALKIFDLASTVSNTDADVYYWMGRCYEEKGNRQEALTNYRRALALDETLSEAKNAIRRLNS